MRRPRRVRNVSLQVRVLTFALLVMAIVVTERTTSLIQLHRDNMAAAERSVLDMLDNSVSRYEKAVATIQAVLRTLAIQLMMDASASAPGDTDAELAGQDNPAYCAVLPRTLEQFPQLASLFFVNSHGITECSTVIHTIGMDLAGRAYFQIALRGIPNMEPVQRGYITGRPAVFIAEPVFLNRKDGAIGVLAGRAELSELFPPSVFSSLGPGTQAIVVSPEGHVILTYPSDTLGAGLDISLVPPVAAALSSSRGTMLAEGPDGVQRVYAYERLPGTNMHLLIGLDQAQVLGPVERATWRVGMTLLFAGIVLLIGIAILGNRLIVAPIQSLANRLIRFGHGDKEAVATTVLITELQPLAAAFESMANELNRRETSLRDVNKRLSSLASLDGLTSIANRRSFDAMLSLKWNTTQQLALLIVDIDHFKMFNDQYGHKEGDHCIYSVAQALAAAIRSADMVARVGGEEFAVLMPGADTDLAAQVGERLRSTIEQLRIPHATPPGGFVTVSVGVAACNPGPGYSPTDLYVAADGALYAAKRGGRNLVRAAEPLAATAASG